MPQNESSLKRHERSHVLRDEPRRVVSNRAIYGNRSAVSEGARRSGQALATIHRVRYWARVFLPVRVEFDTHGVGVEIVKNNLNEK